MNIAIIGAGPGGVSAAIQLKRFGFDPILFEKYKIGGLIKNAWRIENYPGFPNGISGLDFVSLLEEHVKRWNVEILHDEVKKLDFDGKFFIETDKDNYIFDIVIVASGTKPKRLKFTEIKEYSKGRVFYEVYPLLSSSEKNIGVIGSGDAAFDYSINLSGKGNRVYLLNSRKREKAIPLLVEIARNDKNITYLKGIKINKVEVTDDGVTVKTDDKILHLDYMVIAVGREENKDFYSANLRKKEKELISKGLLFLVGDVKNGHCRQVSIAVGDGVKAAMEIYHRRVMKE